MIFLAIGCGIMRIPQLEISFSMGQIAVERQKGSMEIEQNIPAVELEYTGGSRPYQWFPDMEISSPPAKLSIDYSKPLEELGFYRIQSLINYLQNKGREKVLEGIEEMSRDGDFLGKLELGGNRIAQLSKNKMREEIPEVNVALLPKNKPEIDVEVNPVRVKIKEIDIKVENNFAFPKAKIKPDEIRIYLARKGEIDIKLVEHQIDIKI
jgi:hypothetical protein